MGEALWPYERVLTDLRRKITSGDLTGQLPSRLALASQYAVSHMTVQRAIDTLKDEGLVHSVPGLGVFVTPRVAVKPPRRANLANSQVTGHNCR